MFFLDGEANYKGVSVSLSLGLLYTVRMFEMSQVCE